MLEYLSIEEESPSFLFAPWINLSRKGTDMLRVSTTVIRCFFAVPLHKTFVNSTASRVQNMLGENLAGDTPIQALSLFLYTVVTFSRT